MTSLRDRTVALLRSLERYTKTDMVYLATSGFWSNLGTIFVSLSSLILYFVFAHYLSKEAYGTYQYLLSVGAIVGAFTLTGMNTAVTRAVARGYEGSLRQSIWIQLKWNIIPLIGSWAFAAYYLTHHNPVLGWGLVLIGVFVPLNNTFNTYGAFLGGKKDFRRGFLFSLWWNIPYYLAVAIVAIFFKAALVLLVANLVSQAIGLFLAYWATIAAYHPNSAEDPEMLRYGGHLSAMGLIGAIAGQADSILAFHFLGAANLALYSFATAVPDRIGALFKFIPAAAFPKLAERLPQEVRATLGRRLLLGTVASIILALVYIAAAHLFFAILFPAYIPAVAYSRWYALTLVTLMSGVIGNGLTAAGNVRTLYIFNTATPIAALILQVAGILIFGLWGLIGARVLTNLFVLLLGLVLYWQLD